MNDEIIGVPIEAHGKGDFYTNSPCLKLTQADILQGELYIARYGILYYVEDFPHAHNLRKRALAVDLELT